jgi:hypothetical protein
MGFTLYASRFQLRASTFELATIFDSRVRVDKQAAKAGEVESFLRHECMDAGMQGYVPRTR